jgi:hypothetical protein
MLGNMHDAAQDLSKSLAGRRFGTVLADPPWRFVNRTQGRARAPAAGALSDADRRADLHAAGPRSSGRDGALLSLGAERAAAGGNRGAAGLGLRVQVEPRLAQGAQGRRLGRHQASDDYAPDWDTYAYTSRSLAAE